MCLKGWGGVGVIKEPITTRHGGGRSLHQRTKVSVAFHVELHNDVIVFMNFFLCVHVFQRGFFWPPIELL